MGCLEDYSYGAIVLAELVLGESSTSKDLGGRRAIQPFDEALMLRRVPTHDMSDPYAGVFACGPFRRHIPQRTAGSS